MLVNLESLRNYFSTFGELTDAIVMTDRETGMPRGFGFVTFRDASIADTVVQAIHIVDGKEVTLCFLPAFCGQCRRVLLLLFFCAAA